MALARYCPDEAVLPMLVSVVISHSPMLAMLVPVTILLALIQILFFLYLSVELSSFSTASAVL